MNSNRFTFETGSHANVSNTSSQQATASQFSASASERVDHQPPAGMSNIRAASYSDGTVASKAHPPMRVQGKPSVSAIRQAENLDVSRSWSDQGQSAFPAAGTTYNQGARKEQYHAPSAGTEGMRAQHFSSPSGSYPGTTGNQGTSIYPSGRFEQRRFSEPTQFAQQTHSVNSGQRISHEPSYNPDQVLRQGETYPTADFHDGARKMGSSIGGSAFQFQRAQTRELADSPQVLNHFIKYELHLEEIKNFSTGVKYFAKHTEGKVVEEFSKQLTDLNRTLNLQDQAAKTVVAFNNAPTLQQLYSADVQKEFGLVEQQLSQQWQQQDQLEANLDQGLEGFGKWLEANLQDQDLLGEFALTPDAFASADAPAVHTAAQTSATALSTSASVQTEASVGQTAAQHQASAEQSQDSQQSYTDYVQEEPATVARKEGGEHYGAYARIIPEAQLTLQQHAPAISEQSVDPTRSEFGSILQDEDSEFVAQQLAQDFDVQVRAQDSEFNLEYEATPTHSAQNESVKRKSLNDLEGDALIDGDDF